MVMADAVVNKPVSIQASSNFKLLSGTNAPASSVGNTHISCDWVAFDSIQPCDRIDSPFLGYLIDELPDHIIVSILSLLNLKEAARTSILSRRWRYLWTFTSRLVFQFEKSLKVEGSRLLNWVNTILKCYQRTSIDEFTVCFHLYERSCKLDIDNWIIFALEKRVQCLHLDLSVSTLCCPWESYILTLQFLSNYTIHSLKELRLVAVKVSGEVVEYILSTCPLLELLSVELSKSLRRLKVSGPSLILKRLEILSCPLEYIEISATDLVSFSYCGGRTTAYVNNVPNLVEISLLGPCALLLVKRSHHFPGLLSQLESLVLDLEFEKFKGLSKYPKLKNLKHLELLLSGYHARSLLYCVELLKVSPLLQRFTLKVSELASFRIYRDVKEQELKPLHQNLKVIEFVGFVGCAVDVELLLCLMGRAVSLKRLMIDPCSYYFFGKREECKDPELLLAARTRAMELKTRLPAGAELVIL